MPLRVFFFFFFFFTEVQLDVSHSISVILLFICSRAWEECNRIKLFTTVFLFFFVNIIKRKRYLSSEEKPSLAEQSRCWKYSNTLCRRLVTGLFRGHPIKAWSSHAAFKCCQTFCRRRQHFKLPLKSDWDVKCSAVGNDLWSWTSLPWWMSQFPTWKKVNLTYAWMFHEPTKDSVLWIQKLKKIK